jgi:hypothetical protein
LLIALFSELLVYSLVHMLTPVLGKSISGQRARMVAVAVRGALIVTLLSVAIWGMVSFFQGDAGSVQVLPQRMADIMEASRDQMPLWLRECLPEGAETHRKMITVWLREPAVEAKSFGEQAGRTAAHVSIGMIIGARRRSMTWRHVTLTCH